MKQLTEYCVLPLLFLISCSSAYGIAENPDNTWYAVSIYDVSGVSNPSTAFTTFGAAEAAMRQLVPHGSHMVLSDTTVNGTQISSYYRFETEDVISGSSWVYRGLYGGYFPDEQSAVDQFFEVNQYSCTSNNGPMGAWESGSVWYCYPPYPHPYTTEIANYSLSLCDGTVIDPVFCRIRQDFCPEHTPMLVRDYQNNDPNVHGGGRYCVNGAYAVITQYTCDCDETGISRSCQSIETEYKMSFDVKGALHYYREATNPDYNPIGCPEKVEVPDIKDCPETKGNPVVITSGCKIQNDVDYQGVGDNQLTVKRNYLASTITAGQNNNKPYVENVYGTDAELCSGGTYQESSEAGGQLSHNNKGWYLYKTQGCPTVVLIKPNGSKVVFAQMENPPGTGTWYGANKPKHGKIQYENSRYYYYDISGKKYRFYMGQLEIEFDGDKFTRYSYRYNNLETVKDPYGRFLTYAYDANNRVISVRIPGGKYIKYDYDSVGNLTMVIYPDDTPSDDSDNPRKIYLFEDNRFPSALTGIINEKGVHYASWTYDEYGRAITSEHDGGIDKYEFVYLDSNTTLVRKYFNDQEFHESTHHYERINGREVLTEVTKSTCDNCSNGSTLKVYDPETGDLINETDGNGIVTTFEYDDNHREVRRVNAAGTPEETVVETIWNISVNKPYQIIEAGKITEFIYDSNGRLLSKTEKPVQ